MKVIYLPCYELQVITHGKVHGDIWVRNEQQMD